MIRKISSLAKKDLSSLVDSGMDKAKLQALQSQLAIKPKTSYDHQAAPHPKEEQITR